MPIRRSKMKDLLDMQHCNLMNLPENYQFKYYLFHAFCWPQMLYGHRDFNGNMRGYVMAKMEDDDPAVECGHITSISVLRSERKMGVATRLMQRAIETTKTVFEGKYIALHVRCTNEAALALYHGRLGFKVHDVDKEYYGDQEDAYYMRKVFGEDPYGATVVKQSRSQRHDGILAWPEANPEGKLKLDDWLREEAKKKKEAEAEAAKPYAAAKPQSSKRKKKRN